MKKWSFWVIAPAVLFVVAVPLQAQTGCEHSPENPTVVLGLVGSASALFASARARLKARRRSAERLGRD